ncbi:MAG: glycosyltransferase family 61 protein [Bacteroidia bacterium]
MFKRVYNKALSVANSGIGKIHLFLERKGIIEPIIFSFYKNIENRVFVDHKYPVNFDQKDKQLFDHYTKYTTAGEQVIELQDVNISERGVVFKKYNNLGYALPHPVFRATYGWLYIFNQYLFRKKKKSDPDKTYILIYDFWSRANYYHWLVDALPRLWILKEELKQNNYSLLLPANSPKFLKTTLNYFEINNITYIETKEYLQVKKLLVPDYAAGSGHIHPVKVKAIKDHFVKKINAISKKERVYVSRGKQKARRVSNEDQIIEIVKQFGFEVIYFEDHTFEEQVAIGKGAKIMVTSHGANLTNSLFMPEKGTVLELIREDKPNFCYWALSNTAGVNYYYQLCKVVGNDHLLVDVELFKVNLQKVLNG